MASICKRCLLQDIDEEEILRSVKRLVEGLDEEDRTPEEVYRERLALCTSCESLLRGMCRLCGCYVEYRAALRVRSCPRVPSRWGALPAGAAAQEGR